jgi:hypothetical protein
MVDGRLRQRILPRRHESFPAVHGTSIAEKTQLASETLHIVWHFVGIL